MFIFLYFFEVLLLWRNTVLLFMCWLIHLGVLILSEELRWRFHFERLPKTLVLIECQVCHPCLNTQDIKWKMLFKQGSIRIPKERNSREVCKHEKQKEMDLLLSWVLVFKIVYLKWIEYLSPWEQPNFFFYFSTLCPSEPCTVPFIVVIITLVMQTSMGSHSSLRLFSQCSQMNTQLNVPGYLEEFVE